MSPGPARPLGFYDHDRQRYAANVAIPDAGLFAIGDFNDDGTVTDDGEFKITLVAPHVNRRWALYPRIEAFGDATGALQRAIDAGLLNTLAPVRAPDEFARRLLALGMIDRSDEPMGGR